MASEDELPTSDETRIVPPAEPRTFASGRYVVRTLLGEGGQKSVFLVHDTELERDCALSLIKTDLLNPEDLVRLRREAQAMARLTHANIVTVHDIGEEGGRPYIVCEYVTGGDLRGELNRRGGPLPLDRALAIASDICGALAFAHRRGIVHRDMKPENVYIGDDGRAKLGDFGIALAAGRSRVTVAGQITGTPWYMAPEQASGDADLDARTDLYSFGAMLYELVTGRPPFLGDSPMAVMSQQIHAVPQSPSEHNSSIPASLEDVIMNLLAKNKDRRPASAEAVLAELEHAAATGAAPAPTLELPFPASLLTHQPETFVGREAQLMELQSRWDRARQDACQFVLITGEPGIGKSSLAAAFAYHTHNDGALVLYGRCVGGTPLRVQLFAEALRPLLSGPMSEHILPKHRDLAAALAPELGGTSGDIDLASLSAAVTSLLDTQSQYQPIVLVVDDLHRADEETRSLLRHTLYSLQESPLLVVGTYPEDDVGRTHPLTGLLADLRQETSVASVALGGLNEDEVARLIAALAGRDCDAELCRAIHEHTEGNPLFVEEVYNYLSETGALHERDGRVTADLQGVLAVPKGVSELIGRRLSQLSDDCNSLLNIAAVTGREFGLDALERASDLTVDRLLDLVEEAGRAGIIREMAEATGRYEFTHSLTFDTIYEELTSTRRVRLHGQTLQYADNEGVKLAYEVLGATGPYVVALGISNCPAGRPRHRVIAEHWDRVAQDCRLILYDRRGVGSSAAPDRGYSIFTAVKDLEAVLDAVGAQRVILWGAVDGGPLAIQFAAGHPDRVAGLLLLGTTPKLINGDGFQFGVNPAVIQSYATTDSTDRDRATVAALSTCYNSGTGSQAAILEIMHRVPEHAWNKLIGGVYGVDVRPQLAEVRAPALIMHDPANDYIPVEAAQLLHEQIPDSELEITEDYSGLPLREAVYRRIAVFIDQVARRGVL